MSEKITNPNKNKPVRSLPYRKDLVPEFRKLKRALTLFPSGWEDLAWHLYKEDCRKAGMKVNNLKKTVFKRKMEGKDKSLLDIYRSKAKRSLQFNYNTDGKYLGNQYTEKTVTFINWYIAMKRHTTVKKKERIIETLDKFFKY